MHERPVVTVITPPAALLDVATIRSRLGLASTDGADADLLAYVAAATATLDAPDGWLGRALGTQTLQCAMEFFANFPNAHPFREGSVHLPFPPIQSITSVSYVDQNGVTQTLASSAYALSDRLLSPVYGTFWPSGRLQSAAVKIKYVAGYADGAVPAPILQAIILMVGRLKSMGRSDIMLKQETVMGVGSTQWDTANFGPYDQTIASLLAPYRVFT